MMERQSPYAPQRQGGTTIPPRQNPVLEMPLWRDKRRPFFGMPWSFTTYTLYADRLIIESGLLSLKQEEIRLYRVVDTTMRQSLTQRIFRVGSITINSVDSSTPKYFIRDIQAPRDVVSLISDLAIEERKKCGFGMMEFGYQGF